MLSLSGGQAIRVITGWFEDHGWNWAYRTVNSLYFWVPNGVDASSWSHLEARTRGLFSSLMITVNRRNRTDLT